MTSDELTLLKLHVDNGLVLIRRHDSEEIVARILSVSETERDVICDIVSTSLPARTRTPYDAQLIPFIEIESVKGIE